MSKHTYDKPYTQPEDIKGAITAINLKKLAVIFRRVGEVPQNFDKTKFRLNKLVAPPLITARNKKTGQAYLELALCVPIIIVLVTGLVCVGLAIDCKLKVEAVARKSARAASKSTSEQMVEVGLHQGQNVANQYKLNISALSITLSGAVDGVVPARGQVVTAQVRYQIRLFGLFNIDVSAKHSEVMDCWRSRAVDDGSSGSCAPPEEQS